MNLLTQIEQIVREWNGLERGHLESALKVAVMRSADTQDEFDSWHAARAIRSHLSLGEKDVAMLAAYLHRAFVAGTEAVKASQIKQTVVPVPAIVEVEGLRELSKRWRIVAAETGLTFGARAYTDCAYELDAWLAAAAPQSGEGKKG